MSDNKNQKTDSKKPNQKTSKSNPFSNGSKKSGNNLYWIYAVIGVVLISLNLFSWNSALSPIGPGEFEEYIKNGDVKRVVVINEDFARIYLKPEALEEAPHKTKIKKPVMSETSNTGPHYKLNIGPAESFAKELKEWQKEYGFTYEFKREENWGRDILSWLLPIAIMIGLWVFIMRRMSGGGGPGGQIFNIGKSKAQLFDKNTSVKITFNDVAGLAEAKEEVQEIVDFLKNPKRYTELGAKIPKGALLVGPPGTGKTLLAKAVAGEAQVPFYSLSGSDFVEMFVGVGASRVRDLFKQAKEKAPAIIFIDEIDAIGRARGKNPAQGANDERENTLNQLLTEMDGFGTNSGIILLAATNRADILDKALLRPGRFDRQIYVDMPDVTEREEIFKVHMKPLKLAPEFDLKLLSKQTPGFSGADIANICNEAALIAARKKKKQIEKDDFSDAIDRIIGGLEKKSKIITPKEKEVIAFHEAGHATVSWLLEHASPLVKVTIVPRGQSLGAAWYLPEERSITTTEQMRDEVCASLGGRASEELIFGKISTGALSDLEKVTKQVYAMVSIYGLNDKIGNMSYYDSSGRNEYSFSKPYSEKTAQIIDEEVSKFIESAYKDTLKLLKNNKEKLQTLAKVLLEKEVIFREDLEAIFGERPFDADNSEFLNTISQNGKKPAVEAEKEKDVIAENKPEPNGSTHEKTAENSVKEESPKAEEIADSENIK